MLIRSNIAELVTNIITPISEAHLLHFCYAVVYILS